MKAWMISTAVTSMMVGVAAPASALAAPAQSVADVTVHGTRTGESALGSQGATGVDAMKASAPRGPVDFFRERVVHMTQEGNVVDSDQLLGSCTAAPGESCTVSVTTSSMRPIGLALNATRSDVARGLGISAADRVSNSSSCTSPQLSAGQTFNAYPRGRVLHYKIESFRNIAGVIVSSTLSDELSAFDPTPNSIFCMVE
jgi:hypothetical protein